MGKRNKQDVIFIGPGARIDGTDTRGRRCGSCGGTGGWSKQVGRKRVTWRHECGAAG